MIQRITNNLVKWERTYTDCPSTLCLVFDQGNYEEDSHVHYSDQEENQECLCLVDLQQ